MSKLLVLAPGKVHAGIAFSIAITALDQFGNTVPTYTDTVSFTSADKAASLPANYTFVAADSGKHIFKNGAILRTLGNQKITITDTLDGSILGSVVVDVI